MARNFLLALSAMFLVRAMSVTSLPISLERVWFRSPRSLVTELREGHGAPLTQLTSARKSSPLIAMENDSV